MGLFGKKKKKGIMALDGEDFINAYNQQMADTGKLRLLKKLSLVE